VSNEIPPFDEINPTAENLARYLYDQLQPAIEEFGARLDSIGIWETDSYGVVYTPGG
jgi:6-pyruvoyltetrahydropterin/6-carboxytetrahydropterin synthase